MKDHERGSAPAETFLVDGGPGRVGVIGQQQPPCPVKGCPDDFYGPQISLAIDRAGTILAAYVANTSPGVPMRLRDHIGQRRVLERPSRTRGSGHQGRGRLPESRSWPRPGDFRVAWEDDGNGAKAWNVWYRATANPGASWSPAVRLSGLRSGAPLKTSAGFRFPYGDYSADS